MADEVQDDSVVGRISHFLRSKDAAFTCSSCHQDEWWVLDIAGLEGANVRGRFPIYTLACRHCGLIRQHLRSVVDEALATAKDN